MASNVGTVTVTVKIDDSLRERIINLLERSHHDHRDSGYEGLDDCPGDSYEKIDGQWKYVERPEKCDCGASELNSEIDAMIAELKTLEAG